MPIILALCLIGVLFIAAFIALNGFIAEQGETALVINVAGRQRMLSQRIAGLSQSIVNDTSSEALQRDRIPLRAAVNDMNSAHASLTGGSAAHNLPGIQSDAERAYYKARPYAIDARIKRFLADAGALLETSNKPRQTLLARHITDSARTDLLAALNAVVKFIERGGEIS